MFKAKAETSVEELKSIGIENENGYVTGYFVDGFIVGTVVEANDEYISIEWWCPVDADTLERVETDEK